MSQRTVVVIRRVFVYDQRNIILAKFAGPTTGAEIEAGIRAVVH